MKETFSGSFVTAHQFSPTLTTCLIFADHPLGNSSPAHECTAHFVYTGNRQPAARIDWQEGIENMCMLLWFDSS